MDFIFIFIVVVVQVVPFQVITVKKEYSSKQMFFNFNYHHVPNYLQAQCNFFLLKRKTIRRKGSNASVSGGRKQNKKNKNYKNYNLLQYQSLS